MKITTLGKLSESNNYQHNKIFYKKKLNIITKVDFMALDFRETQLFDTF